MWMDWGNDYLTFSDTNIEYIWRFLKECHARGWLYKGHRSTQWCPRCGTSLSQHEQAGEENYRELEHPSLYVRFPLGRPRGRVARRLDDDAVDAAGERRGRGQAGRRVRPARRRLARWRRKAASTTASSRGEELVGLEYDGPFDDLPAQEGVVHRVIPWDEVALDEGTGIVHIAPGAGAEDFELSRVHGLPVLAPIDESGRFLPGYGPLRGALDRRGGRADRRDALRERGLLVEAGTIVHRYPICWRCKTPLVFRVVDDWFIALRRDLGSRCSTPTTRSLGRRRSTRSEWTTGSATWATGTSRASATSGCRCRSTRATCGELNVIGSRAELEERATGGLEQLQELHRPWIDEVPIRC